MSDIRLDDGFSTIITFSLDPTVRIYEKDVTPPGMTGGGPIDTTTMRNTAWRSQAPKALKSLSAVSATVAYATSAIASIFAMINVLQEITITFPDGFQLRFWGWVDEFTPGAHTEGEQPTAAISIQPSNTDNTGAEAAPVAIESAGTGTDTL